MRIIVLMPIYKVKFSRLKKLLRDLDYKVFKIVCIDDQCPFKSGARLQKYKFKNLKIIFNKKNLGVGGAMKEGFKYIKKLNFDYAVKIDGDGQLDPSDALKMIEYAHKNNFNYVIGTRFENISKNFENMPKIRWYGNKLLSFYSKICSGKYEIQDFLNGMICISKNNLNKINLKNVRNNFLFETSMIYENAKLNNKIYNFPMRVKYFKDKSNFKPSNEFFKFLIFNLVKFMSRIFIGYFAKNISLNTFIISLFVYFLIFLTQAVIFGEYLREIILLLLINIYLLIMFIFLDYKKTS
jgi:dolichol-phosphate mannosyltransferase